MNSDREMAREALKAALKLRLRYGVEPLVPACPFHVGERLGLDIRFLSAPTLEGVYAPAQRAIFLSCLRPMGRRKFTCAHELGHHVFGHGHRWDEYVDGGERRRDPEERLADMFAGYFLMPPVALKHAFKIRDIRPDTATPEQLFMLAGYFGVGYATLIGHLQWAVHMLDPGAAERLRRHRPQAIRAALLGEETRGNLVLVDENWQHRAVDLEVGDIALVPMPLRLDGPAVELVTTGPRPGAVRAVQPGVARAISARWRGYIRVQRREFVGRAAFRHLEDVDD